MHSLAGGKAAPEGCWASQVVGWICLPMQRASGGGWGWTTALPVRSFHISQSHGFTSAILVVRGSSLVPPSFQLAKRDEVLYIFLQARKFITKITDLNPWSNPGNMPFPSFPASAQAPQPCVFALPTLLVPLAPLLPPGMWKSKLSSDAALWGSAALAWQGWICPTPT